MSKVEAFEQEQRIIRALDFQGNAINSESMYRQYQKRNSFGLDRSKSIHRIFQEDFLENDIADGYLTLPNASASVWNDPLENPLSGISDIDGVTGNRIDLGALVSSIYAICWTHRSGSQASDWASFSHGKKAVRISTSVGKLMDRVMRVVDPYYMHRAWLIEVDYKEPTLIEAMQNPREVYKRMDSQGALLALSAAVVRSYFSGEDEIRLLFDASLKPQLPGMTSSINPNLVRIPFDWNGFIDHREYAP